MFVCVMIACMFYENETWMCTQHEKDSILLSPLHGIEEKMYMLRANGIWLDNDILCFYIFFNVNFQLSFYQLTRWTLFSFFCDLDRLMTNNWLSMRGKWKRVKSAKKKYAPFRMVLKRISLCFVHFTNEHFMSCVAPAWYIHF